MNICPNCGKPLRNPLKKHQKKILDDMRKDYFYEAFSMVLPKGEGKTFYKQIEY